MVDEKIVEIKYHLLFDTKMLKLKVMYALIKFK